MTAITSTIGVLMENSRLQQEQVTDGEKLARLATALEFSDDAIVLVDAEGNQEYVNKAARELAGGLSIGLPDEGEAYGDKSEVDESPVIGANRNRTVRRLIRNETPVDISISTNHVSDGENEPMGHIIVGRDVTENLRMQQVLIQLNNEREVEANIGRIVSSPLEVSHVFEQFHEEFAKIISFDRLSIYGIDPVTKNFTTDFIYLADDQPKNLKNGFPYRGTVSGASIDTGKCVVFSSNGPKWSTYGFERLLPVVEAVQTEFMGMPLTSQNKIVGSLGLSRAEKKFTEDDQNWATRIGNLISGSVAGHLLQRGKERSEAESQENAARFRQIAENISGGFWLSNLKPHQVIYASPNIEQVMGISAMEFYKGNAQWMNLVHPDDRERVEKARNLSHETGEVYE